MVESWRSLAKINGPCHTNLRSSAQCPYIANSDELAAYLNAFYIYSYRHLIVNTPSCVIDILAPFAESYEEEDEESSGSNNNALYIVLIIVLVSFITCFWVWGFIFIKNQINRKNKNVASTELVGLNIQNSIVLHENDGYSPKFTADDFDTQSWLP